MKTTYDDLPQEVIEKTKRHILDILGVMFPPSSFEKGCKVLEEIAKDGGGREASTLIGFGNREGVLAALMVKKVTIIEKSRLSAIAFNRGTFSVPFNTTSFRP